MKQLFKYVAYSTIEAQKSRQSTSGGHYAHLLKCYCGDTRVITMLYTKYQQRQLGLGPKDLY